ncbi:Cof-type HAD-IIB family hydrolase [Luteimicrobium xylanilyticum]|uniref:5-amino-6-(5-phospho-D-ribitylamino)uracil phosphatase n=1 Tax=Luteimicrobium xylanilyticum TaxID=1133546 RepID=A0A5P9QBC2_9MICO|nr:HAD family hydrolase [Luteimicrobium xylanilyticum]QFU98751.1 5-amino-6-(5-phospho-D-ribitylamino)uracil phosphatase [Luteimicrobium xylanilyticum]
MTVQVPPTGLSTPERRVVFLDVDGTYLTHTGVAPDSARRAVAEARAVGHLVLLCTGRSPSELVALDDGSFDGVVAGAGAYAALADGTVVRHETIAPELLGRLLDLLDELGAAYLLETNGGLYGTPDAPATFERLLRGDEPDVELGPGLTDLVARVRTGVGIRRDDVNKVMLLDSPVPLDEVRAVVGDTMTVLRSSTARLGPRSAEIQTRGVHKGVAVEAVLSHLGVPRDASVGFGDGLNDVEMLRYVGVGVAMGGAHPDAVAAADWTTGRPEEDGLAVAFARLGLTTSA